MENLHKVYYRDYYSDITKANRCLTCNFGKGKDVGWDSVRTCLAPDAVADNGFETISAMVQYPGLVTGIGLQHEINDIAEAMQLGLHFDYTSGMPVIYGSSVKGVLRSYFPFVYSGRQRRYGGGIHIQTGHFLRCLRVCAEPADGTCLRHRFNHSAQ